MATAWEIREANQVVVGILHVDSTTLAWSFGLRNLIIPGREELRRFNPFMPVSGMPFSHARNTVVQHAMQVGASHVFFLDSDVIPPRDAILRLLVHNEPFISGVYFRRSPPNSVPVMIKNGQWITNYQRGRIVEVDLVGAGCLLLRRDMLEKLPPQRPGEPWFDWRVNQRGILPEGECLSEDFTLCQHARRHGYKVLVDTSIVCQHVGFASFGDQTVAPMQTSVAT